MRKKLSESTEHSLFVRTATALVLVAVGVPAATLGGWFLLALSFVAVGFAAYEILALPGRKRYNIGIWILTYVAMYSLVYWQFLKPTETRTLLLQGNFFYLNGFNVSVIAISVYLCLLFLASFFWQNFRIEDVFYLFTMVLLVSLGFYSILFLRYFPPFLAGQTAYGKWRGFIWDPSSCLLLWFVLLSVWAGDTGAYLTGIFFGKNPMNPRISPHKTWEGFFGGAALSIVFSFSYVAIFDYALGYPLLPGVFDVRSNPLDWLWVLFFAFLIPVLDNIGGFMFSAVKRKYGAKDWGKVFPGHGGVLDRFDSVLVTSIAVAIIVIITFNNWRFIS